MSTTMGNQPDDILFDLDETASFFRVSPETVKYLRAQGRFAPAVKIGRRVMWLRGDLITWRNEQRERA
jgi:predicted DNA-binding transcriptional regulator AlpA